MTNAKAVHTALPEEENELLEEHARKGSKRIKDAVSEGVRAAVEGDLSMTDAFAFDRRLEAGFTTLP